jgi:hypothetical protein
MATDIVYTNCSWEAPNEIRAFLDNKTLITWALTHISLEGNWVILRPFNCSKPELKVLSDALADMAPLKFDFHGALSVNPVDILHLSFHVVRGGVEDLRLKPTMSAIGELNQVAVNRDEGVDWSPRRITQPTAGVDFWFATDLRAICGRSTVAIERHRDEKA